MPFSVTLAEKIARVRADLRIGVPVVLQTGGRFTLAAAVETLSAGRLAEMRGANTGANTDVGAKLHIALTKWRAETLSAPPYDGDLVRVAVPFDVPITWLHAMADPALDLQVPIKGPFQYERDGPADAERRVIALCKDAGLLPSAVFMELAEIPTGLACLDLRELDAAGTPGISLDHIASARVPLAVSANARVHVYRKRDGGEEHYAIEIGKPDHSEPVLSRLHSACFTGDLIGSVKCDCGAQLKAALKQIGSEGSGVLLYLNQEGRGIGLANKMRAYALQDQGFDTVEANHRLGFEDDERDFRLGAEILRDLGFKSIRLMTNNPAKLARMEDAGIHVVERVPLQVGRTPQNADYLDTKARKSGHLL